MEQYIYAKIHSLDGAMAKCKVLERNNMGTVTVIEYNGVKCSVIFNPFVGCYYADDIYGVIE